MSTPSLPELTVNMMNTALWPASRERGYCLCIHPFMNIIDFTGLTCVWCEQPVTQESWGPAAKAIRTEAIKAAYPEYVRKGGTSHEVPAADADQHHSA